MNVLNVKLLAASNIVITAAKILCGRMNKVMPAMKTERECYLTPTIQYIGACYKVQKTDSFTTQHLMNKTGK